MAVFSKRKYSGVAICDLNGPFLPGDATYSIIRELAINKPKDKGEEVTIFPESMLQYLDEMFRHCEQGKPDYSYKDFIGEILTLYILKTKGKKKKVVDAAIHKAIAERRIVEPHPYAGKLLRKMKEDGWYLAMLTSTPGEIAKEINDNIFDKKSKFDTLIVAEHKVEDGLYTTIENPITSEEEKDRRVRQFKEEHPELPWNRVLGAGDRTNDWGIYGHCDVKMLMNPDRFAYKRAEEDRKKEEEGGKESSWVVFPDSDHLMLLYSGLNDHATQLASAKEAARQEKAEPTDEEKPAEK